MIREWTGLADSETEMIIKMIVIMAMVGGKTGENRGAGVDREMALMK